MIIAIFLSSAVPHFAVFKEVAHSFNQCIICIIIKTLIWKQRGNLDIVLPASWLLFPKHFMYVEKEMILYKVCDREPKSWIYLHITFTRPGSWTFRNRPIMCSPIIWTTLWREDQPMVVIYCGATCMVQNSISIAINMWIDIIVVITSTGYFTFCIKEEKRQNVN